MDSGATVQFDLWANEPVIIWYDMNGDKKPNRLGFDVFLFLLDDTKGIVPVGTPGYYTNLTGDCSVNGTNSRNGIKCAYYATKDANYFKNLPK